MALHHFKKNELTFETLEGTIGPGKASISRIIGTDHSTTMGGGFYGLRIVVSPGLFAMMKSFMS
ncbi:hypothetical protein [Aneurinibacillus tyrosinisolvens]|uniref:hypothetical protein n=1 Tax=Aneurinibacillus tyrosinisolvens TaxID=1443435 RepID=UPI00063FA794|nr:hypothetical protein [Aneurinibacillus tyrosinisolvens]